MDGIALLALEVHLANEITDYQFCFVGGDYFIRPLFRYEVTSG
jgi:hypothetical protein